MHISNTREHNINGKALKKKSKVRNPKIRRHTLIIKTDNINLVDNRSSPHKKVLNIYVHLRNSFMKMYVAYIYTYVCKQKLSVKIIKMRTYEGCLRSM